MSVRRYNIFISHVWAFYSDQYKELIAMFDRTPNFHYCDYSSPQNSPLVEPSIYKYPWLVLKQKIKNQIKHAHIVLVIAGMNDRKYRDWIEIELEITRKYSKPIIAILPPGQFTVSKEIRSVSCTIVDWDSSVIISSIQRYAI
jgi:hypothetical protein